MPNCASCTLLLGVAKDFESGKGLLGPRRPRLVPEFGSTKLFVPGFDKFFIRLLLDLAGFLDLLRIWDWRLFSQKRLGSDQAELVLPQLVRLGWGEPMG